MLLPWEQSEAFPEHHLHLCRVPYQPQDGPSGQTLRENGDGHEYHALFTSLSLPRWCGFLGSHVPAEGTRWGKLSQPMTNHILSYIDWNMAASIMHSDCVTNHLRKDYAWATPGAQHFLLAFLVHGFNSLSKFRLDKRALFQ